MTNRQMANRLAAKTPQQQFLLELQQGFHYPPHTAQAILETAQRYLEKLPKPGSQALPPGKVRVILAKKDAPLGRPLANTELVDVILTVDNGAEDAETLARFGGESLRRVRILRLLDEALAQGGAATWEDLARVLHVSRRTLQRDAIHLRDAGYALPTRGNLHSSAPGQNHQVLILEQVMQGKSLAKIEQLTHHPAATIRRYLADFLNVIWLARQKLAPDKIALTLSLYPELVEALLGLYRRCQTNPECRAKLEAMLTPSGQKPDAAI